MSRQTQNGLDNKPAMNAVAITPSDSADLEFATRGLYVGTAGHVRATLLGGDVVTFNNLSAGVIHPICAARVWSTGTTATGIVGVG